MYYSWKILFILLALTVPVTGYCQQIRLNSVQYETIDKLSKIVLNVSESPKHKVFVLDNPARLVIDLKNAGSKGTLKQPAKSNPLFSQTRTASKSGDDLRLVVDLKQPVTAKTHRLTTAQLDDQHLIINLLNKQSSKSADKKNQSPGVQVSKLSNHADDTSVKNGKTPNLKNKQSHSKKRFIVAIDAGHGGDDPGAKGRNGTLEKQVTLAIAKKLQGFVNGQPGMKAKLVRNGDYYVGLRERMKIARRAGADLFISIHADATESPDVKGASVYTLSRTGASSEAARWLANSENAKENVGGVNLDDKDEVLASVLLDLSQTATQQASVNLANKVLKNFKNIGELHYDNVQSAGFAVLKSPDIPSILVETAYISNPADELNLMSHRYQNKMANAIFKGILNYFEQIEPSEINRMAKL